MSISGTREELILLPSLAILLRGEVPKAPQPMGVGRACVTVEAALVSLWKPACVVGEEAGKLVAMEDGTFVVLRPPPSMASTR